MVTVAELGSVSVPPGPKLTVPMTLNTALDVPADGVTFCVMIMVDGGLAPFLFEPPRDGVVQANCVPEMPFTVAAVPAAHEPAPPLFTATLGGLGALMVNPLGTNRVTTTFWAGVVVVSLMVQVMVPDWPTFGFGTCAFPVMATAADTFCVTGWGGLVVLLTLAFTRTVPARSLPLAVAELVIAWFCICTITLIVVDAPGSRLPSEQLTLTTPTPAAVQLPWPGCASMIFAVGNPVADPPPLLLASCPTWV